MKTKILSITLIGLFTVMMFTLPSCEKSSNDLSTTVEDSQLDDHKKSPKARPFKGSVDYVEDHDVSLSCDCTDPYFIGDYFMGTGNITHMGKVTTESIPCISYLDQNFQEVFDPEYVGPVFGYNINSQCGFLVAANGDELWLDTAPYTMLLDFDCFCAFTGTTTVTFTGGTGRFENASGSATVDVVNDLVTGIVTATFDGEIYY